MFFEKDFPEQLRSKILASQVVGKRVKLKAKGKEFEGLCPFHNEKTPSFTVNDQKGFYHCFGCGAHGDIIGFVIASEGLEFKEAVIKIADDFGIAIPQVSSLQPDSQKVEKQDRYYLMLEKAAEFFTKNLHQENGADARRYLQKRGLNSVIAKKFRLGFSPNSYDELNKFLANNGFTTAEMLTSGIIGQNDSKKIYDKFRQRLMFPITDRKDRVIAFGGRTLGDDLPKYLNSSETEFFKKNQTLYNSFLARNAIFKKGFAVVVEGYMDVVALVKNGIENVVAGLGTALGEEHLKDLFRTTDKIVVCLDGDSAGIRAAKRVAEIALPLINSQKNITFVILPNGLDPDDFIKEFSAAEIEKLFLNPTPLSRALLDFALMDAGVDLNSEDKFQKISAELKAKIEIQLASKIENIKDVATKKYFSQFFRDSLFQLGRNQKNLISNASIFSGKFLSKKTQNTNDTIAKTILAYIVKFPALAGYKDEDFETTILEFKNEKLTELKELICENIEKKQHNPISGLENSDFSRDIADVEKFVYQLQELDLDQIKLKFRLLLLKDLALQVTEQYKEALSKIDDIETHQTAITNQKIKEIFEYKNQLELKILRLEEELT